MGFHAPKRLQQENTDFREKKNVRKKPNREGWVVPLINSQIIVHVSV